MSIDVKSLLNTYEFKCNLPGTGEEITFKPITTGQMKKLLIYEKSTDPFVIEDALDDLISDCVITEGFDIKKMTLQDRFFLLIEIRRKSKGDKYTFKHKCEKCKQEIINTIDLSLLEVKKVDPDANSIVKINDNLSIEVEHFTRLMQIKAYKETAVDNMSNIQRLAESTTLLFAYAIKKFITSEGEVTDAPLDDKKFIVDNMDDKSGEKFRNWFTDNDFGTDFTTEVKCIPCGHSKKIDIPLTHFFISST